MAKFNEGDRVIAKWTHGPGQKGTIERVDQIFDRYDGTTEFLYDIKLDSGMMAKDRPEEMLDALTEETDLFWVK